MKKSGMALCALLAIVAAAGFAGCSDSDDGAFDFQGAWAYTERITAQSGGFAPFSGTVTIEQNDNVITLLFPGQPPAEGLCNPDNGTFSAILYINEGRTVCTYVGHADGGNTLTGTAECTNRLDERWVETTWTAERVGR